MSALQGPSGCTLYRRMSLCVWPVMEGILRIRHAMRTQAWSRLARLRRQSVSNRPLWDSHRQKSRIPPVGLSSGCRCILRYCIRQIASLPQVWRRIWLLLSEFSPFYDLIDWFALFQRDLGVFCGISQWDYGYRFYRFGKPEGGFKCGSIEIAYPACA